MMNRSSKWVCDFKQPNEEKLLSFTAQFYEVVGEDAARKLLAGFLKCQDCKAVINTVYPA